MSEEAASKPIEKSSRRTQLERTERSEQLMLDAARDLILEVGTAKTTLKEIGERAGYSRGLANARFGSRDALFARLADRSRRHWLAALQRAQGSKTGLEALISRLDAILAFADTYPDEARAMYILWFEAVGAPSDMNTSLARFHRQARQDITELVQQSKLSPEVEDEHWAPRYAARFTGTVFGLCYQWLVNADAIDFTAQIEDLKREIRREARRIP